LEEHGIDFGEQEDVASCMMRIASDKSVNGKHCAWFSSQSNVLTNPQAGV